MKIGTKVKPIECKFGETWEEGIYDGIFGDNLHSVIVTKSKDNLKWASCPESNLEVLQ